MMKITFFLSFIFTFITISVPVQASNRADISDSIDMLEEVIVTDVYLLEEVVVTSKLTEAQVRQMVHSANCNNSNSELRQELRKQKALFLHDLFFKSDSSDLNKYKIKKCLDLSGRDLSGMDLSDLDFSFVDLHNANLSYSKLTNSSLAYADMRCANLYATNMHNVELINTDFRGANLQISTQTFHKPYHHAFNTHNWDLYFTVEQLPYIWQMFEGRSFKETQKNRYIERHPLFQGSIVVDKEFNKQTGCSDKRPINNGTHIKLQKSRAQWQHFMYGHDLIETDFGIWLKWLKREYNICYQKEQETITYSPRLESKGMCIPKGAVKWKVKR